MKREQEFFPPLTSFTLRQIHIHTHTRTSRRSSILTAPLSFRIERLPHETQPCTGPSPPPRTKKKKRERNKLRGKEQWKVERKKARSIDNSVEKLASTSVFHLFVCVCVCVCHRLLLSFACYRRKRKAMSMRKQEKERQEKKANKANMNSTNVKLKWTAQRYTFFLS